MLKYMYTVWSLCTVVFMILALLNNFPLTQGNFPKTQVGVGFPLTMEPIGN